jgi:Arc/MetJ family transcription regulator
MAKATFIRTTLMRTTLTLGDELLAKAQDYTGVKQKSALVRWALQQLVEREAARRLAWLGGSQPGFTAGRRWQPETE